jgi:hypothetical protein
MAGPEGETLYPALGGLSRGERIVASGSFLVDAETRLNPAAGSVYFGGSAGSKHGQSSSNVRPSTPEDEEAKLAAVLTRMPVEQRRLVEAQQFCPILEQSRLGSMGTPVKVMIEGTAVFLCCDGCKKSALAQPKQTLEKVAKLIKGERPGTFDAKPTITNDTDESEIQSELAKLAEPDRKAAEAQRFCVVLPNSRLGSMGKPQRLAIGGKAIFVCCEGCTAEAIADPQKTLSALDSLQRQHGAQQAGDSVPTTDDRPESSDSEESDIAAELNKLSAADRAVAVAQKFCVVLGENRLGSMGSPIKLMIGGKPVFLCCAGCKKKALADPKATLDKAAKLKAGTEKR